MNTEPFALALDLERTPFSRRGSYLAVSKLAGAELSGHVLRSVHGDIPQRELIRLVVGSGLDTVTTATPGRLALTDGPSRLDVVLSGSGRVLLHLPAGVATLELQVRSQYDVVLQEDERTWRYVASGARRNYLLHVDGGRASLDTGWDGVKDARAELRLSAAEGPVVVCIDEFGSTAPTAPPLSTADVDAAALSAEACFSEWLKRHGAREDDAEEPPLAVAEATRLAAFVTWGALVPAGGALLRESMLMSKNHMTNVWAWDHCFNAMALWRDPDAAADQLMTVFDHQDEFGALPDYVNDVGVEPNFVKPPIHGWAVSYLLDRDGLPEETLRDLYEPLARWTDWWFEHRDFGGDGVPSYTHGNDSGWDNSTVFGRGVPVQSPDLLAFLALQMSTLARLAEHLGRPIDDAVSWRRRAAATVNLLVARFWVGGRFVARMTATGEVVESDSLITLMPLVLGDMLPAAYVESEVGRLVMGGYLTAHGPATEPIGSPSYEPDGYWRGPIWAPSTMLLVDGLERAGYHELAADIGRRFVATCVDHGMAENFDAITGEGLRDRSMTWTASAFLAMVGASRFSGISGDAQRRR